MTLERNDLSRDAVNINGQWLEDIISGYATLTSTGRENLAKSVTVKDIRADGGLQDYSKYPSRTITVTYVLDGSNASNFRLNATNLFKTLDVENAEIKFNDEFDKYYIGTISVQSPAKRYGTVYEGTFQIICNDPFKYSDNEVEVALTNSYDLDGLDEYDSTLSYDTGDMVKHKDGEDWKPYQCNTDGTTGTWNSSKWDVVNALAFIANNNGSYKTYPRFEVDFATDEASDGAVGYGADCGFVQFAKAYEDNYKRIQFGDDEEEQITPTGWSVSFLKNTLGGFVNQSSGTVHGWNDDATAVASTSGVKPKYGNATNTYHGALIGKTATSNHDFTFSWTQAISLTADSQTFGFMALALDSSNNIVAGVKYYKGNTTSKTGTIAFILDGQTVKTRSCSFAKTGKFGYTKKTTKRVKSGNTVTVTTIPSKPRASTNYIKRKDNVITIKLADSSSVVTLYPETETPIAKVRFFLTKYKTKASPSVNYIRSAKFSGEAEGNTFTSSDVLNVDCNSANITLNEVQDLSLGDVGNQWDDFYLDRGQNVIYVAYSDWCQMPPTFKMYYRERWI